MASIVVVGASQGGVEALRTLVSGLPSDFPVPILLVLHTGAAESLLCSILEDQNVMPASRARDGEKMRPGHIYCAAPDHHLLVSDGRMELSRGPRENWARPAIDPLFRTAAEAYGDGVIGVVLTGGLNDGTSGLYEIKRRGGTTIVQDPSEAQAASMPESALQNVDIDFCLPVSEIAKLLVQLVHGDTTKKAGVRVMDENPPAILRPIAQTCPECGGAMWEEKVGSTIRFRCHIGHAMTAEVLAALQVEALEKDLSTVFRTLNERADLCREMAEKYAARGSDEASASWAGAGEEAQAREKSIRALTQAQWQRPENMTPQPDAISFRRNQSSI
jgi:two-component system chemotaxis response regulator CheB